MIEYGETGADSNVDGVVVASFKLAAEDLRAAGTLDRDVDYVFEQVQDLPEGRCLGNQKMTVAAMRIADMQVCWQRS